VWPASFDRRDEGVNKVVVFRTPDAPVAPTDIKRVSQPFFVFGSDIEQNWQARFRRDTGQGAIESHLPNRNAHAAGTLVTQAKNTFAVAHDNAFDPGVAWMGKDLID
jgi:hypothetical protein